MIILGKLKVYGRVSVSSSAVWTFSDPDGYAASIRATRAELTVTGRGRFAAKLIRIDLHRLWIQRFFDNLPRISHIAGWGGRAVFAFRTQPGMAAASGERRILANQRDSTRNAASIGSCSPSYTHCMMARAAG